MSHDALLLSSQCRIPKRFWSHVATHIQDDSHSASSCPDSTMWEQDARCCCAEGWRPQEFKDASRLMSETLRIRGKSMRRRRMTGHDSLWMIDYQEISLILSMLKRDSAARPCCPFLFRDVCIHLLLVVSEKNLLQAMTWLLTVTTLINYE